MQKYKSDISGNKFYYLTAIKFFGRDSGRRARWLFLCKCGKEVVADKYKVCSGHTRSCGCLLKELTRSRSAKHGFAAREDTKKVYMVWAGIRRRCLNKNQKSYNRYGGRNIKICKRWLKFENFIKDMGEPPTPGLSIERIDNNKGYNKNNCKWATKREQSGNTSRNIIINYKGIKKCLKHWTDDLNIDYLRFKSGFDKYRKNLSNDDAFLLTLKTIQ